MIRRQAGLPLVLLPFLAAAPLCGLDQRLEAELRRRLDSPRAHERGIAIAWAAGRDDAAVAALTLALLAARPDLRADATEARRLADALTTEDAERLARTAPEWLLPHVMRRLAGQGTSASLAMAKEWSAAGRTDLARLLALAALPAAPAGDPAQAALLELVLGLRDPAQAAEAIARIPHAAWDPALASMLLGNGQERIRKATVAALARTFANASRSPPWLEGLLGEIATSDQPPAFRLEALQALRLELPGRGRTTLLGILPALLQDKEAALRTAACSLAMLLGQAPDEAMMERLLADQQAAVRFAAVRLATQVGFTPSAERQLRLLDDPDAGVRREFLLLAQSRRTTLTPAAIQGVLALARQGVEPEALAAAVDLDRAAGLDLAAALCVDPKRPVAVRVRALSELHVKRDSRISDLAQRCLADSEARVRAMARRAVAVPEATGSTHQDDPAPEVDALVQSILAADTAARRELLAGLQKAPQAALAPTVYVRLATGPDLALAREAVQRLPLATGSQDHVGTDHTACLAALRLLDSPDAGLAAWAAKCLAALPYRTWRTAPETAGIDGDAPVELVMRWCQQSHPPDDAALLAPLLAHPSRPVRFAARQALASLGYPHPTVADFALADALSTPRPHTLRYAQIQPALLLQRLPAFAGVCPPEALQELRATIERLAARSERATDVDRNWQRFLTSANRAVEAPPPSPGEATAPPTAMDLRSVAWSAKGLWQGCDAAQVGTDGQGNLLLETTPGQAEKCAVLCSISRPCASITVRARVLAGNGGQLAIAIGEGNGTPVYYEARPVPLDREAVEFTVSLRRPDWKSQASAWQFGVTPQGTHVAMVYLLLYRGTGPTRLEIQTLRTTPPGVAP